MLFRHYELVIQKSKHSNLGIMLLSQGQWEIRRMGRLPTAEMILIVYCVIREFTHEVMKEIVPINKNTWTFYIMYVGMICGKALKRNRRDPDEKYLSPLGWNCKRKYHRSLRFRNGRVQWALTAFQVDQTTGKFEALNNQFLPLNKWYAELINPLIVQRMRRGGTLLTDCWNIKTNLL